MILRRLRPRNSNLVGWWVADAKCGKVGGSHRVSRWQVVNQVPEVNRALFEKVHALPFCFHVVGIRK